MIEKRFSIGVDLGGTNLRVAAYDAEGEFLQTIKLMTRLADGRSRVVRDMCEAVSALCARHSRTGTCVGIGIGSPGPLELPSGVVRNPPNLPGWDGFDLRRAIEDTLEQEIVLENDANVAAFAEYTCGTGKTTGADSLCMLTLGTGVGSGLILNREIWHGGTGMGGEVGHVVVDPCGVPCGCGGLGCLEQYASATAIVRMMAESSIAVATAREAAEMAASGDITAQAVFRRVGKALAIALTGAVNTLNLPLYAIGGGGSQAWELFAPSMFEELEARCYIYRLTAGAGRGESECREPGSIHTLICRAELGPDAGLLGACLLGLQGSFKGKAATQEVRIGH